MAEKITSRTTLKEIRSFARCDFGASLTTAQARQVKDAARRGLLVWTPAHLVVCGTSREAGFTITPR